MKILITLLGIPTVLCASPIPEFPFLYVEGEAHEDVPTQSVRITFSIVIDSEMPDAGEEELKSASRAVMTLLRKIGVQDHEIDASEVRKRRRGPSAFEKRSSQEVYFSFIQEFILESSNLKLYPDLAEQLIGSKEVSHFESDFFGDAGPEFTERLRRNAFKDAKGKAVAMAAAGGATVGRMYSASEEPLEDLERLIGGYVGPGPSTDTSYREKVYEVPSTVSRAYRVFVLYRITDGEE